jgi:hypothetical protein
VARCPVQVQVLARGVRPACLSSRGVRLQLSAPHFSSWIRSEALRIGPFNGPSRDASLGELRWGSAVPQRRRHRRPVQLTNLSTLYRARAVHRPAPAVADPASTTGRVARFNAGWVGLDAVTRRLVSSYDDTASAGACTRGRAAVVASCTSRRIACGASDCGAWPAPTSGWKRDRGMNAR